MRRISEYLAIKGNRALWLPVLKQGGALFPTSPLQSSPRFENSVFGTLDRGAGRLDVLELLLSVLEEKGQEMIPVLDFDVLLSSAQPIESTAAGPLDKSVQASVVSTVGLLLQRYAHHTSLTGVAIELNVDSPLLFANEATGINRRTAAEFLQELGLDWPADEMGAWEQTTDEQLSRWILQQYQIEWLKWRSERIVLFVEYLKSSMDEQCRSVGREPLQLHLILNQLHRHPQMEPITYPSLRNRTVWFDAWTRLGMDLPRLEAIEGVGLIFQRPAARSGELAENRRVLGLHSNADYWQAIHATKATGVMVQQPGRQGEVEALRQSPSDNDGRTAQALAVMETSGGRVRQWSEILRGQDCRWLLTQAAGLDRGLNVEEDEFTRAFQSLPARPLDTLFSDPMSPVVVRGGMDGRTPIMYAVNAAPWPVRCRVEGTLPATTKQTAWRDVVSGQMFPIGSASGRVDGPIDGSQPLKPRSLSDSATPRMGSNSRDDSVAGNSGSGDIEAGFELLLPPHGLMVLQGPILGNVRVQWREQVEESLEGLRLTKESLFRRLRQAGDRAVPMPYLQNGGFEDRNAPVSSVAITESTVPMWTHGTLQTGQSLQVDQAVAHVGQNSLKMTTESGVLWLRSQPIPVPRTGRISVALWLRNYPERPAASVRFSIDGQRTQCDTYYRYAEIPLAPATGGDTSGNEWFPVAVHFEDLPEVGLSEIRVGVDMMQPGSVWIDSVQCFDRWLDASDQRIVSSRLGLVAYALENKRQVYAAWQALDDYWLKFLMSYIQDPNQNQLVQELPPADPSQPPVRGARGGRRLLPFR